jgi:tetratricopeptide (TPR) repeat protein
MSSDDFLGIEDINREVSANPAIATKVFRTICEIFHDKVCDSGISPQLTIKTSTHDNNFIGREDEIKAIDETLDKSNSLLLINGIGGIGKSSLANHYLYIREKEFDYYGFIEGLGSFISEFRNSLNLKSQKEDELYREIIYKLQKLNGNNLLVIDNVEDIEANKTLIEMILSLGKYNYKILFTSRRKIKKVKSYHLGTLLPIDAQKLFLSYYETGEVEKVDMVIEYLGLHTLFIKLVADTIENEGYSLDDILQKFENGELSKIEFIDEESGDEITFNHNLQELFSMQNLKDEYVLLLKRLAVLPSIDIELSFLEDILDEERLKGRLNFLVGRGWLIESEGRYKLHQIIKEYLLANHAPLLECANILFYFYNLLPFDSININSSKIQYIIYFESVISVYELILGQEREAISMFLNRLGVLYLYFGNYKLALSSYEKALQININLSNNKGKSASLNNIAEIYQLLGDKNKALEFYQKSIKLTEQEFGLEDPETAIRYNNIARLYDSWKEYNKSLIFYTKSLKIREKVLGFNNYFTAQSYNNIGVYYENQGNFKNALYHHKKALSIRENIFGKEHIETSESYHNLGTVYYCLDKFGKSLLFIQKALILREKKLGFYHYKTADTYASLAGLYFSIKKYEQAFFLIKKAIKIYKKTFSKNHKNLIKFQEMLTIIDLELNGDKSFIIHTKIKRHDPCPCNSGKKYKKCCGKPK